MATIIDGKAFSANLRGEIARQVAVLKQTHSITPGLAVVLVGEDPASVIYTRNKEKAAAKVGIAGTLHRLAADVSEAALLEQVGALNADDSVDGLLVQLPLPGKDLDADEVVRTIDPAKDVDGLHPVNVAALWRGEKGLVPCTPAGRRAAISLAIC